MDEIPSTPTHISFRSFPTIFSCFRDSPIQSVSIIICVIFFFLDGFAQSQSPLPREATHKSTKRILANNFVFAIFPTFLLLLPTFWFLLPFPDCQIVLPLH